MSLDLFACHAVKAAFLGGDLDSDTAQVLSLLPKSKQESALRQLKALPDLVTGVQLLRSIETQSLDLTKTEFDCSKCKTCLHLSDNANVYIEPIGAFQKGRCLFSLCAQHGAQDEAILNQRTVLSSLSEEPAAGPSLDEAPQRAHQQESATSPGSELPLTDEPEISAVQAQFELVEPDVGEADHSDDHYDQRVDELTSERVAAAQSSEPMQLAQTASVPPLSQIEAPTSELPPRPSDPANSYIEQVRNAWWRDALSYRVAESGSNAEMQGFLNACFASGFTIPCRPNESPVTLFLDIVQEKQGFLPTLVQDAIAALPLEVINAFLIMFGVDLTDTGKVTVKLLSAHTLEALVEIANELNVESTDSICDAYDAGPQAFAKAIFDAVGEEEMAGYIPPSLRL